MPYKDPDRQREYRREWARKNHRIKTVTPYHKSKKKIIHEAKNKPCAICGQQFPVAAMDLHHIDPTTKEFTVASGLKAVGYEKLIDEINKCVVLCAVCHRLLHGGYVKLSHTLGEVRTRKPCGDEF